MAHDVAFGVEHGHAAGDRVERGAQLARRFARLLVEPRIHHGERELRGEALEHPRIIGAEIRLPVHHRQHADRAVGGEQRRRGDLADAFQRARRIVHGALLDRRITQVRAAVEHPLHRQALVERDVQPLDRRGVGTLCGHHVHIVAAAQHHAAPFAAEDRHRVPQGETEHVGKLQRTAHRAGHRREGLALPLLAQAVGVQRRVRERRRGRGADREEQFLFLDTERTRRAAVYGDDAGELVARHQWDRQHRRSGCLRTRGGIASARASGPGHFGDGRARRRGVTLVRHSPTAPVQGDRTRRSILAGARDHHPIAGDDAGDLPGQLVLDVVPVERAGQRRTHFLQSL